MYLAVQDYRRNSSKEQPRLASLKKIRDNMIFWQFWQLRFTKRSSYAKEREAEGEAEEETVYDAEYKVEDEENYDFDEINDNALEDAISEISLMEGDEM